MSDFKQAEKCAERLSALAEPNRMRIIDALRTGSRTVTELAMLLKSEIVNVSHHLKILRLAGLVEAKKFGRFMEYALSSEWTSDKGAVSVDLGVYRVVLPAVE
ncbi:ArsR/SmtB family transcription factor [Fimbriiglobus ruber]|uniref:HTH arsR-type domain-containing protein n=1 Tax=Fimbriiglobus ruber TaxID=1908690 RepID=A0A225E028_9BACT|nr:metalloregulator ArsR/SmtB family transcription factor [Fimbriiglobus ruber]OWK41995.1 hypothetical protein FRUB_04073 [Fimbriiglobus ruber]